MLAIAVSEPIGAKVITKTNIFFKIKFFNSTGNALARYKYTSLLETKKTRLKQNKNDACKHEVFKKQNHESVICVQGNRNNFISLPIFMITWYRVPQFL